MRISIGLIALVLAASEAASETDPAPCPAEALGTARVLPVDAATTPRLGRKHFAQTLALTSKEVVLTFDDGPLAGATDRVLDALKRECARAAFFLLGRNALSHPQLARRALSEGKPGVRGSTTWMGRLRSSNVTISLVLFVPI